MLPPVQIIARKRDGGEHTRSEIAALVEGYVAGEVHDHQMAAWAMAVCLRGMTESETAALTESMWRSGVTLQWDGHPLPRVDKHSTGGIGDKSSLILAPLLACCGVCVPMVAGRALGATGGTLDKLESIPGFRTNLSARELSGIVERIGCVITGATSEMAPADRKLYALRDVTATVESIPLIAASILSKKLAEGLDALALDVKCGAGAFMKTVARARELAQLMVRTCERLGVRATALVTDMNQPTGRMVGNAVEVNEALETLSGRGPSDLVELVLALGGDLLLGVNQAESAQSARAILSQKLHNGQALEKFREMVAAQGGALDRPRPIETPHLVCADRAGFLFAIHGEQIGQALIALGGGRTSIGAPINHAIGMELLVRLAEPVEREQPLARFFAPADAWQRIAPTVRSAFCIADAPPPAPVLIAERIQ